MSSRSAAARTKAGSGPRSKRKLPPATEPSWVVIGSGRVGRALVLGISSCGGRVALAGRTIPKRGNLPPGIALVPIDALPALAESHLILAVPDDAIRTIARQLVRIIPGRPRVALHTSGSRPLADLAPLERIGWSVGSLHPIAAFPPAEIPFDWAGCPVAVAGKPSAKKEAGW